MDMLTVPALAQTMPTLAVATIYCIWWRAMHYMVRRRDRLLRDRVAYMLWVMANEAA
jgi:hypothetical protein